MKPDIHCSTSALACECECERERECIRAYAATIGAPAASECIGSYLRDVLGLIKHCKATEQHIGAIVAHCTNINALASVVYDEFAPIDVRAICSVFLYYNLYEHIDRLGLYYLCAFAFVTQVQIAGIKHARPIIDHLIAIRASDSPVFCDTVCALLCARYVSCSCASTIGNLREISELQVNDESWAAQRVFRAYMRLTLRCTTYCVDVRAIYANLLGLKHNTDRRFTDANCVDAFMFMVYGATRLHSDVPRPPRSPPLGAHDLLVEFERALALAEQ